MQVPLRKRESWKTLLTSTKMMGRIYYYFKIEDRTMDSKNKKGNISSGKEDLQESNTKKGRAISKKARRIPTNIKLKIR